MESNCNNSRANRTGKMPDWKLSSSTSPTVVVEKLPPSTLALQLFRSRSSSALESVAAVAVAVVEMEEDRSNFKNRRAGVKTQRHHCDLCPKSFSAAYYLKCHLRVHAGTSPFQCDHEHCAKMLPTAADLKLHLLKVHSERPAKTHECHVCQKLFCYREDVYVHVRAVHSQDRHTHKCEQCNKTFTTKRGLQTHEQIHTGKKMYVCEFCSESFCSRPSLNRHLPTHTKEKPYKCTSCDKTFARKDALEGHAITHTEQKILTCELCPKQFLRPETLAHHVRIIHAGAKPYKCQFENCGQEFTRSRFLLVHARSHSGETPLVCNLCGKSNFDYKSRLTRHMEYHKREEAHTCAYCSKSFRREHGLKAHLNTHTGAKQYSCPLCPEKFLAPHLRHLHLKTHEAGAETGETTPPASPAHKCEVCDWTTKSARELKRHSLDHVTGRSLFECEKCAKKFATKIHLNRHEETHSEVKPYTCNFCGNAFKQNRSLINHVRIHTAETPYSCDTCGMEFENAGKLRRHRRVRHPAVAELQG